MQNTLELVYDLSLSLKVILQNIKAAYNYRKHHKDITESLSLKYRHQLELAKDVDGAGEGNVDTICRSMNQVESQRRLFRNIRHMEGKVNGESTSTITAVSDTGHTIELT